MRDAACTLLPPALFRAPSARRTPAAAAAAAAAGTARGRRACSRVANAVWSPARDAGCRRSSAVRAPQRLSPTTTAARCVAAAPGAARLVASAAAVPRRQFFAGAPTQTSLATTTYASKFLPEEIRKAMCETANEQKAKVRMFPPHRKAREEGKDKIFYTWPQELKERYYEQYLAAERNLAERRSAAEQTAGAGSETAVATTTGEPVGGVTGANAKTDAEAVDGVTGASAKTDAEAVGGVTGANAKTTIAPAVGEDVPVGTAVHALAARIGLVTPDIKNVAHVLQRTREGSRFSCLGRSALVLYASEYLHMQYPLLPNHVMSRAIYAYVGNEALTALGYEWGVNHAGRFDFLTDLTKLEEREVDCQQMADVVRGLIGVLAAHRSQDANAARLFIHAHVLSRSLDVKPMINFERPRDHLVMLTRRQRKEPPTFRILKESGRLTNCPIFVVGVYSGLEKLAEGYGSSLQMAKFRAARTALRDHYMTEVKDFQLPSDTLIKRGTRYVAQPVGQTPADSRF